MSLDPERALQSALIAALSASSAIKALLSDPARVYGQPPDKPGFPHLTVGPSQSRPSGGLDGEGMEHVLTLTCASRFRGVEEAQAVIAAVRALLHGADLTLTDHRLVNLRVVYADVIHAADWRLTYGLLRLRAVTEPL